GIGAYTGDSQADGNSLAQLCLNELKKLDDPEQFPPRLLILLVSPAYLDLPRAGNLLIGIHQTFAEAGYGNLPLIGCSAAAVFFNQRVHREGALLVCLASRLLQAEIAVAANAAAAPEEAVNQLLAKLKLRAGVEPVPASLSNRTLFSFLPGFDGNQYPAPLLHQLLRENVRPPVPIFGGVASADDPGRIRPGILFAGKEVHQNAIVAASVAAGTPMGISLGQGLSEAGRFLRVAGLSEDRKSIRSFLEGSAAEIAEQELERSPLMLLAEVGACRDSAVDSPKLSEDGAFLSMMREVSENACFSVMRAEPERIYRQTREDLRGAIERAGAENPVACLAFKCAGLLRFRQKIGLDFEHELALVEQDLRGDGEAASRCFGAFLDGEAGVDAYGKSLLGNWGTAAAVFSDELTERAPLYASFARLSELARAPFANPAEAAEKLLAFIHETGFRGAMLSLRMPDQQQDALVAQAAVGSRFKKIVRFANRPLGSQDVVIEAARDKRARFVADSQSLDPFAAKAGIVSQYILPLVNSRGNVPAVLQFDLGDIRHCRKLPPREVETLNAMGDIVLAILDRVFGEAESKITLQLDKAMEECVFADNVNEGLRQYLELALHAFGLEGGHIRLAQEGRHSLSFAVSVGRLYEATRHARSEVDFGDISPLARAFREDAPTIVNDAASNIDHQWLCDRYKERGSDDEVYAELKAIVSFAHVPFITESGERGMISLFGNDPWFFNYFHVPVLRALRGRVALLLENLKRKFSEKFLLSINPRLPRIQTLDDMGRNLTNVTEQFARSINAEFASLFLWDEDQQVYILRAQYNWHEPKWVNAARYRKGDVWTGSAGLAGAPRHIPDLFQYFEEHHYSQHGLYNEQIFGRELSERFTVEVIGLPLRIGNDQIGVMALYRRVRDKQPGGFLTTDPNLLTAGAAGLTGTVRLLQANGAERWEKEELHRHQEIYEACTRKEDGESFESRVCRQALKSYRGLSADFYGLDADGVLEWKAGLCRNADLSRMCPIESRPLDRLSMTDLAKLVETKKTLSWRREVREEDLKHPATAAICGLVERVCIPLLGKQQLVGVLDLRWQVGDGTTSPGTYRHSEPHLQSLGEKIGAAYQQYQLEKSQEESRRMREEGERLKQQAESLKREMDERSDMAVKATGAYVFQSLHRLANAIQNIKSLPIIINQTTDEEERAQCFVELRETINSAGRMVESVKNVGERVSRPHREDRRLEELIQLAMEETFAHRRATIKLDSMSFENVIVRVDPGHTKEVFVNLFNNALDAMREAARKELTIQCSVSNTETVTVKIQDTGRGMTEEEIQAAERGFVSTHGHKGVGVLITRVLLNAQRGTLTYRSEKNIGTEAIVTLPLA
ncbi:MAG TPA: ATP-binding protein, partial [Blastocatellia bacterium]|nr:ATP-binding protein [Blastocatellia bacterium]